MDCLTMLNENRKKETLCWKIGECQKLQLKEKIVN